MEEYILPERWCCEITNESIELLNDWRKSLNKTHLNTPIIRRYGYITEDGSCNYWRLNTEITFEQFKKYVLKEDIETPKEVILEYVECIGLSELKVQGWSNHYTIGNIYKINSIPNDKFTYIEGDDGDEWACDFTQFKPSTKEAFDAKNQSKHIEKWSVGSYVVFLCEYGGHPKGVVDTIVMNCNDTSIKTSLRFINTLQYCCLYKNSQAKWFATKSEAEEFAKTLVEPVKIENGILDMVKPKQPLKQAVHCKTQEEWDFVLEKLNYKFYPPFNIGYHDTIDFINLKESFKAYYKDYQILSFQEWCDLNGYKMGKEVKFEIGKWYKLNDCWWAKFHSLKGNLFYMSELITADFKYEKRNPESPANTDLNLNNTIFLASIEEIQQYLPDNHPDKIKSNQEFKVGNWVICIEDGRKGYGWRLNEIFMIAKKDNDILWRVDEQGGVYTNSVRHATSEEINNHLISIGQISAGEPLNTSIEPNKQNIYQFTTAYSNVSNNWCVRNDSGSSISNISKPKMILSIDDKELPMVNIIKTNSIKQLLNND